MKPVNITVSIVEDHTPTRVLLAEWIRRADGFKCVGLHESGETAFVSVPQEKPDVVLMDNSMPGVSGIDSDPRLQFEVAGRAEKLGSLAGQVCMELCMKSVSQAQVRH